MDILMIKPWGEDGIYVPQMKMPQDNYGERLYSLNNQDVMSHKLNEDGESSYNENDDETDHLIEDNPENDYSADSEAAGDLLYTEDTEAKIGNLPYSDDVEEQFEDIHKDSKR